MKNLDDKNRAKLKKAAGTLAGIGLAVLFFVLLAGFGRTAPENPMEERKADASCMYLTSSTLAMDQEKLADVENANISSGGTEEAEQEEQEEEEQQEENQEEQQENQEEPQEQQQSEQPTDIASEGAVTESLLALIQKNQVGGMENKPLDQPGDSQEGSGEGGEGGNGGGIPSDGGQQSTLNPSQSSELFTTSLKDGDEVTDPEYPFTITLTEKGKQLTLVSMMVTLNGNSRVCKSADTLNLQEGANTVKVTVRFRDSKYNQIDASTKVYTIFYIPDHGVLLIVKNAKTGAYLNHGDTLTVYEDNLWIEVTARKASGGSITDVSTRVRMRNQTQTADSDGIYRMKLSLGDQNQLKVTAGEGGNNQKVVECTVNYKVDGFALSFESAAFSEKISNNPALGDRLFQGMTSKKYSSTSPDFAFRINYSAVTGAESVDQIQVTNRYGTVDMKDMAGADGYIHLTLDASQATYIKVYCTDSEGKSQWYTWVIAYERLMDASENQKKAPIIRAALTNETVYKSPFVLGVKVFDYNLNELLVNTNFSLYLNGQYLNYHSRAQDGTYEYNLYLTEGENSVKIIAKDNEGYTAEKNLTVRFTPDEQDAQIHVIVSAEVVGLGTLIDEQITTSSGKTVAQIVEERLLAYGYTTIYDGTPTSDGYFLRHIQKTGIAEGWSISESERSLLEMLGYQLTEGPNNVNSLGEKDFTAGSGWMITLNHYYIGQTMGSWGVRDGDEIHLIYTLSVGKDIGVNPEDSAYE